jgi:hypothetical protein
MTFALEPWWARDSDRLVIDADGWTLRSADGSNTAHSEHTIAITETGPRILTPVRLKEPGEGYACRSRRLVRAPTGRPSGEAWGFG